MALNISSVRDTKWLTLEVCRQFQRGNCSRSNEECKFAHPPKSCQVENGRVIACFDSLKVRRGANAVSTCKSFLYSMDVGVGWYRLVFPTPNNIFWIMSRPSFITRSVKKNWTDTKSSTKLHQNIWVGFQPVDSLWAPLAWVTPSYFNLLWHIHCRATIQFCRRIMLSHCFCILTVDMLYSTCSLSRPLLFSWWFILRSKFPQESIYLLIIDLFYL